MYRMSTSSFFHGSCLLLCPCLQLFSSSFLPLASCLLLCLSSCLLPLASCIGFSSRLSFLGSLLLAHAPPLALGTWPQSSFLLSLCCCLCLVASVFSSLFCCFYLVVSPPPPLKFVALIPLPLLLRALGTLHLADYLDLVVMHLGLSPLEHAVQVFSFVYALLSMPCCLCLDVFVLLFQSRCLCLVVFLFCWLSLFCCLRLVVFVLLSCLVLVVFVLGLGLGIKFRIRICLFFLTTSPPLGLK